VGRINPAYFLGGRVALDVERARTAFAPLAERIGVGIEDAALGVIRLANANMLHLLKLVSVRRGRDPREFAIVACGGGGPMHATALARELQVPRVIVPPHPAHFSAWGMLVSDLRHDFVQTRFTRFEEADLGSAWADLERSALELFADERVDAGHVTFVRTADMRYAGQEHAVNVPAAGGRDEVAARFHELHEQLYAFRLESPIEIVNFRLTAFGSVKHPEPRELAEGTADGALKGARQVHYDELGATEARVYERDGLGAGASIDGPAVVEEPASNTVVFPDQTVRVDRHGNLIVERRS
jgi:N-methylhydantoinase A